MESIGGHAMQCNTVLRPVILLHQAPSIKQRPLSCQVQGIVYRVPRYSHARVCKLSRCAKRLRCACCGPACLPACLALPVPPACDLRSVICPLLFLELSAALPPFVGRRPAAIRTFSTGRPAPTGLHLRRRFAARAWPRAMSQVSRSGQRAGRAMQCRRGRDAGRDTAHLGIFSHLCLAL
jgi:hypothetical protein